MKDRFIDVVNAVKRNSITNKEAVSELCILFNVVKRKWWDKFFMGFSIGLITAMLCVSLFILMFL